MCVWHTFVYISEGEVRLGKDRMHVRRGGEREGEGKKAEEKGSREEGRGGERRGEEVVISLGPSLMISPRTG